MGGGCQGGGVGGRLPRPPGATPPDRGRRFGLLLGRYPRAPTPERLPGAVAAGEGRGYGEVWRLEGGGGSRHGALSAPDACPGNHPETPNLAITLRESRFWFGGAEPKCHKGDCVRGLDGAKGPPRPWNRPLPGPLALSPPCLTVQHRLGSGGVYLEDEVLKDSGSPAAEL